MLNNLISDLEKQVKAKQKFNTICRNTLHSLAEKIHTMKAMRKHIQRTSNFSTKVIDNEIREMVTVVNRLSRQRIEQMSDYVEIKELIQRLEKLVV